MTWLIAALALVGAWVVIDLRKEPRWRPIVVVGVIAGLATAVSGVVFEADPARLPVASIGIGLVIMLMARRFLADWRSSQEKLRKLRLDDSRRRKAQEYFDS